MLTGTVTLAASASSTAGIASVRIDRAPSGTTSWSTVCTDQTAPYSCSWNTTTVADGSYDFRAVLVDGRGVTTTSTTMSSRRVDNSRCAATTSRRSTAVARPAGSMRATWSG